jgi:DedD protein
VPEPRTHYQVSFTSRQAVLLFVAVLAALTGAYFLGLVTGLAGRQPAGGAGVAAVSAPTAVPTAPVAAEKVSPPVTAPPAAQESPPPAMAAREPGKAEGLQFFEDRPAEPTAASPAPSRRALAPAKAAGGFWVQTLSTKSEREAKSRRAVLSGHGYRVIVESSRGAGGPILYRVRVGPFSSREEASKAAQALERKEKAKTWIVPPGE